MAPNMKIPKVSKHVILKKGPAERKPVYHDIAVEEKPIPALKEGYILVKMTACAYNHREVRSSTVWPLSRAYATCSSGFARANIPGSHSTAHSVRTARASSCSLISTGILF